MNHKTGLIFDIILIVCILLSLCLLSVNSQESNHQVVDAKMPSFDTLEEMEQFSDIIVRGVRLEGGEGTVKYVNGVLVLGYTMSQFSVTDVYQDSTGMIQTGTVITVLENEVFDESTNTVYHVGGYSMMEEGHEYLLFAYQAELSDGTKYFVASGVNFGTVSLENDQRYELVQRASAYSSGTDYYSDIWAAAKDKYLR